jgi:tetratricopeptide (TPR) repeat protein
MNSRSSTVGKIILYKTVLRFAGYFLLLLPAFCYAQTTGISVLDDGLLQRQKGNYSAAISLFAKALEQHPENYLCNLEMGIALWETGRPDSALLYLDRAIKIEPTKVEGYENRGAVFYALRAYAKGDNDARMALRLQPASGRPYELLGYSLVERKEYSKAILTLDSAISKDKTIYKAYVNKAGALSYLKRYQEAIAVLDQVITLKPDYLNAYYNRADTYKQLDDIEHALADCNKLLDLDNRNIDALLLRAVLKDRSDDDVGAIEDCDKAIAIDPKNAKAYNQRAIARFDLHDNEGIISDCNQAIALEPYFYDPYIQRGDAYDELGDYDKAIADYSKAISLDSTKLIAYRECAASVANKKDYKASLYYLSKGLQLEPGNKYLLEHKYQLQQLTGDLKGAISTLNQCIKFHPDSAMVYNINKAYIYDTLHDYTSACKCAFDALKGGAEDGYDYIITHPCAAYRKQPLVMAEPFIQQSQKDYLKGMFYVQIASLTKAIALLPDSSLLYYNRAGAKRQLNDFSAAIEDYSKAISLRPKFPDAIAARAVAKRYLNDIAGAMKDYQLAIKVDSTYAIAYNNIALMLAENDVAEAINYLTKAVHFNKKYASAYLTRGKLYLKLGKKEEACADFKKAEALGLEYARIERMVNCK